MKTLPRFALALLAAVLAARLLAHDQPAPGGAAAPADAGRPRVLVYSDTAYYRHPDIPAINRWLVLLGHENGLDVDLTEHPDDLQPGPLAKYDVLLLNNANQLADVIPEARRQSVQEWFARGDKGVVALHAALVHQTRWPWLVELGGCDFNSDSDFLKAKVLVDPEAADHPAVAGQPAEFWVEADWTNHTRPVTGLPGFQVLLRVDESTYEPVRDYFKTRGGRPMGPDHPIAWTNTPEGGGRFFYTEFGHDLRSLGTPFVRRHVLEGIRWAAASKGKVK